MEKLSGRLATSIIRSVISQPSKELACEVAGVPLRSPVILAAGLDKDARCVPFLGALGVGAVEVGSVTSRPQPGNPRPRMFRYPEASAIINRMGFPSEGVDVVRRRLKNIRDLNPGLIIGVNVGKAKDVSLEDALNDYCETFKKLYECGDYFVINVSSPNTPGLRKLQDRDKLEAILNSIQKLNIDNRPIFLKVAPDLEEAQLDDVVECAVATNVNGLIATNTTVQRESVGLISTETGGLSGRPLFQLSLKNVRAIATRANGRLAIIGVGGIFSADDVVEMLKAGASAVQLYSAFIYNGPTLFRDLNRDLVARMKRDGVSKISDYVGHAVTSNRAA